MKLTELDPQFLGAGGEGISDAQGNPVPARHGVGIGFDCPCGCGERCYIEFVNPLDGKGLHRKDGHVWNRTGDTFETLTLSPSIQRTHGCRWHGFIENGETRNA